MHLRAQLALFRDALAKTTRAKHEGDFDVTLPALEAERRAWLRKALELAHPGHAWLERL